MREHGDGGTPLWVSEIGWGSRKRHPSQYNFGRHGQARMVTNLFSALSRERHRLHLSSVTWFDWRDSLRNVNAPCPWCDHAGLIDKRNHRKPAWDAYRRFVTGTGCETSAGVGEHGSGRVAAVEADDAPARVRGRAAQVEAVDGGASAQPSLPHLVG